MKKNTKDTDSFFDKIFAKYPSKKKKKNSDPDRFNKSFSFSIYSRLLKKADEVSVFWISNGSNSIWYVLQGAVNNFASLFRV